MYISQDIIKGFLMGFTGCLNFGMLSRKPLDKQGNPKYDTGLKYEEYGILGDKMRMSEDFNAALKKEYYDNEEAYKGIKEKYEAHSNQ